MNIDEQIQYLKKINLKNVPQQKSSQFPKNVIKTATSLIEEINNKSELTDSQIEKLISINDNSNSLRYSFEGKLSDDFILVYKTTKEILNKYNITYKDKINQTIELLNSTYDQELSKLIIEAEDDVYIEGNRDGLRELAKLILETSIGEEKEIKSEWISKYYEGYPPKIVLNHGEEIGYEGAYEETWKDKLAGIGCGVLILFCLVCTFVWIIKWFVK